jgi:hypothetical protein
MDRRRGLEPGPDRDGRDTLIIDIDASLVTAHSDVVLTSFGL